MNHLLSKLVVSWVIVWLMSECSNFRQQMMMSYIMWLGSEKQFDPFDTLFFFFSHFILTLCVTVRLVVNSSVVHSFGLKVALPLPTLKKLAFSTINFSFLSRDLNYLFREIYCLKLCVLLDQTIPFFPFIER